MAAELADGEMDAQHSETAAGRRYYRAPKDAPDGFDNPDALNALTTEYEDGGWLSTLVWNTRNTYLAIPEATFTADQMRMVCEGFLVEVAALRVARSGSSAP